MRPQLSHTKTTHIGLMGTHGTGKSTYARRLFHQIKHTITRPTIVTEVARACPYSINQHTSREAQLWIFNSQLVAELEAMQDNNFIICDRTVLDSLVYAEYAGLSDVVDACMPTALMWLESYTQLLWFRPAPNRLVEDGFRDTDPKFQQAIDKTFAAFIRMYHIEVEEVTPRQDTMEAPRK